MKKLLALVLTLVMTMSLMTITNAATFTDDASIDYKEAVEVMAAVGVLAGDGSGGFAPEATLTRAQAAKIVTYLMLGADAAEGLVGSNTFSDVAATNWAAGYISYLASEGVVAGVGGGKFDPNGEVTALQFAKMLLVALGYDATVEKLVGSDWSIKTSKLAYDNDLFAGNDDIKVNNVATRQEAALYAFNALKVKYVYYPTQGTTVVIGDTQVVTGGSTATENKKGETLAEKLYPKLKGTTDVNGFGQPVNVWTFKGQEVGQFAATPVVTFTTAFNTNEMLDAVKAAGYSFDTKDDKDVDLDTNIKVYTNGVTGIGGVAKDALKDMAPADTDKWLDEAAAKVDFTWSKNGLKVEFFADDNDCINYIVATEAYLEKVTGKVEDKVGTKTIDERALTIGKYTIKAEDEAVALGFDEVFAAVEEDDYVVVIPSAKTAGKAVRVYLPTEVTGDVSYYKKDSSLTVAGTNYANSATAKIATTADATGITVYLDEFGYALGIDGSATASSAAVVLNRYQGLVDGALTEMALLLYADGTTASVPVVYNAGSDVEVEGVKYNVEPKEGKTYLYETNDDDYYAFADVPTVDSATVVDEKYEGKTLKASVSKADESTKGITIGKNRVYFANGVKFIYVDAKKDPAAFTVSDTLQTIKTATDVYALIDGDGYITSMFVFAKASNYIKDSSALIFVAEDAEGTASKLDKDGKSQTLQVYDAFIDGVKVEGFMAEGKRVGAGFYENEYDTENGWYVLDDSDNGNKYDDSTEDIKVTGKLTINNKTIERENLLAVAEDVAAELTSATKYASNIDGEEIGSLAELNALIVDDGTSAEIYVVYDNETGVALYVYVTKFIPKA